MELYDLIKFVLLPVMLCYIGFNERDKINMKSKLEHMVSKDDMEKFIDMKMMVHQVQIQDVEDRLERMEVKIDTIIDRLPNRQ